MKPNTLITILVTAATVLTLNLPAWGAPGDGTGNGGSPVLLRTKLINEYIHTELRNDALAYMSSLRLDQIASPPAQEALKRMLEQGILTDIRTSAYVIQSSCKAIGGQDAGGAVNGDLGGDICLSPEALAKLDSTKAEIVGLVIHEHAHHFGYEDKDYAIYDAVYKTVRLSNPGWSDADQPSMLGMNFVKLGPASFWMGSPPIEAGRDNGEIQHLVHLTTAFEIQTTTVTQAQYIQIMGENPSRFQNRKECPGSFVLIQGVGACPNHPVERVSYHDALHFISRLNSTQRQYFYRLPTEAEWEFAARGGSAAAYSFGDDPRQLYQYAWIQGNSAGETHAVASLKPNAYGLYDMHGNVVQWVRDWFDGYPESEVSDPRGPSSGGWFGPVWRVTRGCGWFCNARGARSAFRDRTLFPTVRDAGLGFRLVRTPR